MTRHFAMNPTPEEKLQGEIRTARTLFEHCGCALSNQPELLHLLSLYDKAIGETQDLMLQMGVSSACADCAGQGPGSCCFEGIESGYDHILLLINLLMGCAVPDSRRVSESCFFVGKNGCTLRARYYYCVSYLCPALQAALGPGAKDELADAVGRELAAGFELEGVLRQWLRKKTTGM